MQKKWNVKKIIVVIVVLVTGVLLYCGCNYQKNIVIGEQNAVLNDVEKVDIAYFNEYAIFYTKVNQFIDGTYTIDDFYYYNRENKNTQKICELENASIQNIIDMGDNIFMCVLSHREKGEIMKLDLNKNTNEILYQWDSNPPVSYSDKWTDDTIVTFYPESIANGYIYHFSLFDNITGKQKEFLKTTYDEKNNVGDIATRYCFYHNDIVIYHQKYDGTDNVVRSLDIYDMDGNLKDSIVIDIAEFLDLSEEFTPDTTDTIKSIHNCGNHIVLCTQHNRVLFFNMDSKNLVDMKYYDILHKPLTYYNTVNDNYAIFYNGASKRTENNDIIIFDGNKGKFYNHSIVIEQPFEKENINYIELNDNDEILITTAQNHSSQCHYFIVNAQDIAQ